MQYLMYLRSLTTVLAVGSPSALGPDHYVLPHQIRVITGVIYAVSPLQALYLVLYMHYLIQSS